MENVLKSLYERYTLEERTLGILLIQKEIGLEEITNFQDVILLVLLTKSELPWSIEHYSMGGEKIAMHFVNEQLLNQWMASGDNPRVVDWIFNGKILFQKNIYIEKIKDRVRDFPLEDRKKKIAVEYAKLIRHFEAGKSMYQTKNYLDSFFHILQALHHQARLAIIERGFYPEVTVWNQVKYIEPEMYKLYQEMLAGDESIEKKIELVMIANEFAISSKLKVGSVHLIHIIEKKGIPVAISSLMKEDDLREYHAELELLMNHLTSRGMVESIFENLGTVPNKIRKYKVSSIVDKRTIM